MINNLFSIFDPSSSFIKLSWLVVLIVAMLIIKSPWIVKNPVNKLYNKIIFSLKKEIKFSLGKVEKSTETIIITVFFSILVMNFLALYPQVFSPTSHLTITLPLSLLFWTTIIIFGWMKNTKHMLTHLLPQGTPPVLIMFIVAIELTRNLIRPITLCVRLTANLIAGHLLITLLGNALASIDYTWAFVSMLAPITLTILESAVACIQAYVFITLITLYTAELK